MIILIRSALVIAMFGVIGLVAFDKSAQAVDEVAPANHTDFVTVLKKTYLENPAILSERSNLKSVEEVLPQAISGWLPNIEAETSITANDTDTDPSTGSSDYTSKALGVSLSQNIFRGGTTVAETRAARHTISAAISLLISQEQSVLLQSATAYMDVYRDRALLDLALNNKKVIERQLEATTDRFEVGELTRTDVQQAKARLADAEAIIITATGSLRNSEATFQQYTGLVPGKLSLPDLILPLPKTFDEALTLSENSNPNIIAAISSQRAAEDDVDGVFGELLPQVTLNAGLSKTYDPSDNLDSRSNGAVGLTATIPLYQSGAVRSRVRQAKHTANERYMDIMDVKRSVRQQAIQAWQNLRTANAEITARLAQVEASEIAREGVKAEADYGSRTVLDALDADQELLDAQVALVTAQRNKVVAEYSLLAVVGLLNPYALGFGDDSVKYGSILEDYKWDIFNMNVDMLGER